MDALSDVLGLLKPRSYLTAGVNAGGDWAIRFGNRPGTIKCHAVLDGGCWLAVDGATSAMRLTAGDCVILPSGCSFKLASDLALPPTSALDVLGHAQPGEVVIHNGGGDFLLAGTRFEVDGRKAESLLGALPSAVHLHTAKDRATLRWYIEEMKAEMREGMPGGALAEHHLAHLMLLQAFRLHLAQQSSQRVGLLYALSDAQLGKAIEAIHADPAHRWTLGELASKSGLSRSIFAQRFRARVGEPPIAYLTRWRMMLAAERLVESQDALTEVAGALGYESENAFSTAFKRVMGCSPRRYAHGAASDAAAAE